MQVFSDATITVPLVVQALRASGKKRESVPVFDWKEGRLEVRYEKRKGGRRRFGADHIFPSMGFLA